MGHVHTKAAIMPHIFLSVADISRLAASVADAGGLPLCCLDDSDGISWRIALLPVPDARNEPCWAVQALDADGWQEVEAFYILEDAADYFLRLSQGS